MSGTIVLGGTEYRGLTPRQAIELGVATVYQEPELIESLTVADNIYLGDEKSAAFPLVVDTRTQNARARDLIRSLHFNLNEEALVEDLSSAQKQMLQIVKARYRESKIIIMDEPTSSFGLEETNALMNLIRSLKAKGIGIIYISHFLEQIFEIGDRITILKDGESMGTFARARRRHGYGHPQDGGTRRLPLLRQGGRDAGSGAAGASRASAGAASSRT